MRRYAGQPKVFTPIGSKNRRMEWDLTAVDHAASLSRRFPIITAIIITFLIECGNGIESFPALVTTTLTKRCNVSQVQLAMRAYANEGNFLRIQQSVEARPGDVKNLRRLLRGEQGIVGNQRNRLTILQVLEDFAQHRIDLYRNILGNAIRPNELELIGWLSVNKESAKYMPGILGSF